MDNQYPPICREHETIKEMKDYLVFMGYFHTKDRKIGRIYESKNFGKWGKKAGKYYTEIYSNGMPEETQK